MRRTATAVLLTGASVVLYSVAGLLGCTDEGVAPPSRLTAITVEPAMFNVTLGDSVDLTATGRDQFGAPIDLDPIWQVQGASATSSQLPMAPPLRSGSPRPSQEWAGSK